MIVPLLDDEPVLEEIAERNIRENERLKILFRLKNCTCMQEVEQLVKDIEKSINLQFD